MSQHLNPNVRDNLQPVYQNRKPHEYPPCSINATTTNGRDNVSYRYQTEASHNQSQIKGDESQPVHQFNREGLLSRSKQYRVLFKLSIFFSLD